MERFAPNTAALDTPIVEGEAMALESVVCMTRPATESAAPAMSAASTRGTRIERTMRTLAAEPFPNRAATPSERLMRDAPTKRQTSAMTSTASASAAITCRARDFAFMAVRSFLFLSEGAGVRGAFALYYKAAFLRREAPRGDKIFRCAAAKEPAIRCRRLFACIFPIFLKQGSP